MNNRTLVVVLIVAAVAAMSLWMGWMLCERYAKPRIETRHDTTRVEINIDSLRATLRAEIKPEVRTRFIRDTVESEAARRSLDSLLFEYNALLAENSFFDDIVAEADTTAPDYHLMMRYHYRDHRFSHRLDYRSNDTTVVEVVRAECETTWLEDAWDYTKPVLSFIAGVFIGRGTK